jgi:pantetheine-phosphate adenylyltransferase
MNPGPKNRELIGLYPGTFDPVTLGHADIIMRAAKLVDHLVLGVAWNPGKNPLFTPDERCELMKRQIEEIDTGLCTFEVRTFDSLMMQFAREVSARVVIRGLRAASDFEYEFQMVGMNQQLDEEIETVFLMADPARQYIASKLVKEISKLGGDVSAFVNAHVNTALKERFAQ